MNPHLGKPQRVRDAVEYVSSITGFRPQEIYVVANRPQSHARFHVWAILRDVEKMTWHQIARRFEVDHTSVIYGVRSHRESVARATQEAALEVAA